MDFELNEEQQAIFDMARDFGAEKIAPFAAQWEKEEATRAAVLEEAAALGLAAIYVPEEDGGSGLTRLDATLVFEALSMACPSVASFLSIHNMCAWMVSSYGSDEMKLRLLPDLVTMTKIASYCLTEPGSGSDASALRTRAERTNEGYRLNGTKAFISGGGFSDLYLVMTRTGVDGPKGISAVIVEDGTPGLSFGAPENKMGWRSQPTSQVQFDDCVIPADNLLGEEGAGFRYAMSGLDGGRLNIAASARAARNRRSTRRLPIWASAKPSAKPSTSSRRFSSGWPTWRRKCRRRGSSCARRQVSLTARPPMRPSSAPWPSVLSPTRRSTSPMTRCSCMADTATWPIMASRRSSGIFACTRSLKAPTRSCG
jgi:hypothetical protein